MNSSDKEVISHCLQWLEESRTVILVTVIKTWGSSPRPTGSLMAIRDDGVHVGSVSGGCVEDDLLGRAQKNQLASEAPTIIAYGTTNQQAAQFNLPCGGRIELLVELLSNAEQLKTLLKKINAGELICRRVCLNIGEISLHVAKATDDFSYQDQTIKKVFGPRWQIFMIGAGHLTQCVTQMATMLDYKIIVCDPREEYQQAWPLSDIEISTKMPDDAFKEVNNFKRTIVLALSHDPKLDDMVLLEALKQDCFYIGALGSKRNNEKRRARLTELGLSQQQVQKMHGPVGIDIGSHTPAEIAISILADITAKRNLSLARDI